MAARQAKKTQLDDVMPGRLDQMSYASLIARHGTDAIVVTGTDGLVEWANPAFQRLSGYTVEEMQGRKPGAVLQGADTDPGTVAMISQALKEKRQVRTEILNYSKTGDAYWIELNITPVFDASGKHTHFMSIERDVTERKRFEQEAREAQTREASRQEERRLLAQTSEWLYAAKSMEELLAVVRRCMERIVPEASGALYIYSNSRDMLERTIQWGADLGGEQTMHMEADDCWSLRRGRAYAFGGEDIHFVCGHHRSREDTPSLCLPLIAHGDTIGMLSLVFSDLSIDEDGHSQVQTLVSNRWELSLVCAEQISLAVANVRLRQQLQDQSVRDQLTGLWNRRWFMEMAQKELNRTTSRKLPLSLVSLDVDHFKLFNDHHGHDAGDIVLREVGALMRTSFGGMASPCRLGGEEFTVIVPEMPVADVMAEADAFRLALSELSVRCNGATLPRITISGGVATAPDDGTTLDELIKAADTALYAAKAGGRDCILPAVHRDMDRAIAAE